MSLWYTLSSRGENDEEGGWDDIIHVTSMTCSMKWCDKNGQFFGFVRHIYIFLFETFKNIHT